LGMAMGAEYSAVFTGIFLGIMALIWRPLTPASYAHKPLPQKRWPKLLLFFRMRWHLLLMLIGSLIPVAVIFWFHKAAFGSYFTTPYSRLSNTAFSSAFNKGFMGFQFPPKWETIGNSLFAPSHGLLFWTPFLFFVIPGAYSAWKYRYKNRNLLLTLLGLVLFWLFYHAIQFNPRGGWSVGPRYIANIVPFIMILAVWGADQLYQRYGNRVTPWIAASAIWSILHYSLASVLFPHIPTHSELPQIEIIGTMLWRGLSPMSIVGLSPKWSILSYLAVLFLLFLYILWAGFRGPRRKYAFVMTALILLVSILILFQLPAIDYNYRQGRLLYVEGLIPPAFRW